MIELEQYCKENNLPAISREKAECIQLLAAIAQPKTILEVGTLVGYSTLNFAEAAPEATIITCERDIKNAQIAQNNFTHANKKNIKILVGDAKETLTTLTEPIDLLFLDATKKEYLDYFNKVKHLLHPGSLIIADNILDFPKQLQSYLEFIRTNYNSFLLRGLEITIYE